MLLSNHIIKLRALEPTDLDLLYLWENNTEIWSVSQTLVPFSQFVLKQYLETQHKDIFTSKQLRLVVENMNRVPVGLIDLFDFDPINERAGLGILIDESHRGKGYAKAAVELMLEYAFGHLHLHQVYVNVGSENQASIKIFESFGFNKVGVKKDWIKTKSGYDDELIYQLIN